MHTDDVAGRPLTAVLADIVGNIEHIIDAEVRLAELRVRQGAATVTRGAALLIAGGAVALLALGYVLLACVYALSLLVPPWSAALLVAGLTAGIGATLIAAGTRQLRRFTFVPTNVGATIEERLQ